MASPRRTLPVKRGPRILMLHDYRGHFYSSVTHPFWTMRLDRIVGFFREAGCEVRTMGFSEIDIRNEDLKGWWVLYTSQEDGNLFYKNFIEDVILAVERKGGTLVPRFELFRAHHDKVFMEYLRDTALPKQFHTIRSFAFGTYEEAERAAERLPYPLVVKPAEGAMSTGVALVRSRDEFLRHARAISLSDSWWERFKQEVKKRVRDPQAIKSLHRRKFIAQTFIAGLQGDYKVLIYGDRYFPFRRDNRENDFRASGSGRFHFEESVPLELLEVARTAYEALSCPFLSLDVGFDGARYHLLEMQCLMFGNIGLERSVRHFRPAGRKWREVRESADLEHVFADSVMQYIAAAGRRRRA